MTFSPTHQMRKGKMHNRCALCLSVRLMSSFCTNRTYRNRYREDKVRKFQSLDMFLWTPNCDNALATALCSHVSIGTFAHSWSTWCETQSPSLAALSSFYSCRKGHCSSFLKHTLNVAVRSLDSAIVRG